MNQRRRCGGEQRRGRRQREDWAETLGRMALRICWVESHEGLKLMMHWSLFLFSQRKLIFNLRADVLGSMCWRVAGGSQKNSHFIHERWQSKECLTWGKYLNFYLKKERMIFWCFVLLKDTFTNPILRLETQYKRVWLLLVRDLWHNL